jgi:hypothetical protein
MLTLIDIDTKGCSSICSYYCTRVLTRIPVDRTSVTFGRVAVSPTGHLRGYGIVFVERVVVRRHPRRTASADSTLLIGSRLRRRTTMGCKLPRASTVALRD